MILGIDTSTTRLSLAVREPAQEPVCENSVSPRRHNEAILPKLESLLTNHGYTPADITGVAVGLGPGSFTGVRIGIATAMGLAQSLSLPVIGISSFLTIAAGVLANRVLVIGDARQNMLYASAYEKVGTKWQTIFTEQLLTPDGLADCLPDQAFTLAGPEAGKFYPELAGKISGLILAPESNCLPDAGTLIKLADKTLAAPVAVSFDHGGTSLEALVPIYLRRTHAEEMREKNMGTSCETA
ncbi:tRNA (adenosine(37)-N6)-threonylcarbamoyltransferase complex dimerization subunit type 1 TsaB [bacterium]|nr:tRNA (adenosine(37)-N6)-threonylcarbamoyltransferase complex dimerization subunit type 1 TsaB [bacterium]